MNHLFFISCAFQDVTFILYFLIDNRCLLYGCSMAGSNSYSILSNRWEMLTYMGNYKLYILMNHLFFISCAFQDVTLILYFLINNRCLLYGYSMAGSNSYSMISNRWEMLTYIGNYKLCIYMNNIYKTTTFNIQDASYFLFPVPFRGCLLVV